jgi:hypothetical protein
VKLLAHVMDGIMKGVARYKSDLCNDIISVPPYGSRYGSRWI